MEQVTVSASVIVQSVVDVDHSRLFYTECLLKRKEIRKARGNENTR